MKMSEAKHRANEKYNASAYDEIKLRVRKDENKKELIQTAADRCGESVNTFINRLIDTELGRMGLGGYGNVHNTSNENL